MAALATAALLWTAGQTEATSPEPWEGYDRGVRWERSLEDAKARAAKERKPILLFQLVGDLDREGC
jgi:hypothetical protein